VAARKDPNYFGRQVLATASGLTIRNLQHLDEAGLLPVARDVRTLKRLAAIGAFAASGMGPISAARLVTAVLDEFNQTDGEVPSGVNNEWRKLSAAEPNVASRLTGCDGEFALFEAMHELDKIADGELPSDVIVEFKAFGDRDDKRVRIFVHPYRTDIKSIDLDGELSDVSIVGWVEGWGRGSDESRIVRAAERINLDDPEMRKQVADDTRRLWARKDAVIQVTVNVSLAIRRAFCRVIDFRKTKREEQEGGEE
jgi:hypothetical protein